jgi:hypothetical protein
MKNNYDSDYGIEWYHVLGGLIFLGLTLVKVLPFLLSPKVLWPVGIIAALLLIRGWLLRN